MSKQKNILVITYWAYNSSILKAYALPYIHLIKKSLPVNSKLFLLTLTPKTINASTEYLIAKEKFRQEGIELINYHYYPFGFKMALKLIYIFLVLLFLVLKNKVKYIHAWCTPGGAIGWLVSVFTGKPLILDSFEPHAQSMVETKTWKKNGLAFKLLFQLEKWQLRRSQHVICAAEGMITYSQKTYRIVKSHYFVKPACVNLDLFSKKEKDYTLVPEINANSIVCVYIGKFGDIYLAQEVFDFFKIASVFWGKKFKVLLLTNHSNKELANFCKNAELDPGIIIKKFIDHNSVPFYLALGHFGICPVRPVPSKAYCTPIKNAEYWAMGLPIVITKNISTDSKLIADTDTGYVLQELTNAEYLNAVKKIEVLLKDTSLPQKIRALAEKYRNYTIAENIYTTIYE